MSIRNLQLASFWTLLLLIGMLLAVLAGALYFFEYINFWLMIGLTLFFNFLLWILSPYLIDFSHLIFFKMRFLDKEEFEKEYPDLSRFIKKICQKHNIPFPKMRVVNDGNPTAYSYGSGAFNARVAFSQGLIDYLSSQEVEAVLAHELGHIVHRDFIVISIANTILQLLYQIYLVFSKRRKGKRNPAVVLGLISYIFYLIGTYVVLYLSRIREYYADSFSARETKNPHLLSRALVKIAYGIITFKEEGSHLIESTKTLGIMGIKDAKSLVPLIKQGEFNPDSLSQALLFDLVNPWAKLFELSSSHPLVAKRLKNLDLEAKLQGKEPLFNIQKYLNSISIDKKRLWRNFFVDAFFYYLPFFLSFLLAVLTILERNLHLLILLPGFWGMGVFLRTLYRFQDKKEIPETSVIELMSDIYASPTKGRLVKLKGKIIGRGVPGYYLSEDLMYQDPTGLIYFDYQSGVPLIGNIFFALRKVKKLIGKDAQAVGWFLRGNKKMLTLKKLKTSEEIIRSHPRLYAFLVAIILIFFSLIDFF